MIDLPKVKESVLLLCEHLKNIRLYFTACILLHNPIFVQIEQLSGLFQHQVHDLFFLGIYLIGAFPDGLVILLIEFLHVFEKLFCRSSVEGQFITEYFLQLSMFVVLIVEKCLNLRHL